VFDYKNNIMRAYKLHLLLTLIFCCATALSVLGQGPGKNAYMQAENLRKTKRYAEAVQKYDEAIKLEAGNYRYFFARGKCYYEMKEYDLALSSFEESIEYKKDNVFAYTLIAKIYRRKNDNANAVYYYDLAFQHEQDPKRKVSYKMEAIKLLLQDGKTADAQKHLQEVKAVEPDNPNILYFDAKISNENGDYENARKNMEVATTKLEGQPPAQAAKFWYELGYACNKLGDYACSSKSWEKAYFGKYKALIDREKSINSPAFYYRIAMSYYTAGDYDRSREQINKSIELQNNFSAAYLLMGKIDKKQGNYNEAIQNYKKAANFEEDPTKKAKLLTNLGSLQVDAGDYSGALGSINEALSKQTGNPQLTYLKSLCQYHLGQYESAISGLEALSLSTQDAGAKAKYSFLIGMCAKNTDVEKAKAAFKSAAGGAPFKAASKVELDKLMNKAG
jgi:tetratricopeptide (TPR) repeat protein